MTWGMCVTRQMTSATGTIDLSSFDSVEAADRMTGIFSVSPFVIMIMHLCACACTAGGGGEGG